MGCRGHRLPTVSQDLIFKQFCNINTRPPHTPCSLSPQPTGMGEQHRGTNREVYGPSLEAALTTFVHIALENIPFKSQDHTLTVRKNRMYGVFEQSHAHYNSITTEVETRF